MRPITLNVVLCIILLLVLSRPVDTMAWWWPFGGKQHKEIAETRALPESSINDNESSHHKQPPSRLCKFTSPIDVSLKRDILLLRESQASGCRYELVKTLTDDLELCHNPHTLRTIARIATICHYRTSERVDMLPLGCVDDSCTKLMNAEVFQVFTAFYLHAESICREVNAQLWMENMESLIQNLGVAGQETLDLLETMRVDSRLHFEEQQRLGSVLLDELEAITNQQLEHFSRELEFFNSSKRAMRHQEDNIQRISSKLGDLHMALGAFDNITTILLDIQQNQQWSKVWTYFKLLIFYILALSSFRIAGALIDKHDPVATLLWRIHSGFVHMAMIFETGLAVFSIPVDCHDALNVRLAFLGLSHSIAFCIIFIRGFLSAVLSSFYQCDIREIVSGNRNDAIQDLIQDIIWLKMHIPSSVLDSWTYSGTLRRLLETPPEGYRRANPLLDGEALPVAWYSTQVKLPEKHSIEMMSSFFDDKMAVDSAHCIVAVD